MVHSQGLDGPQVLPHLLPAEVPAVDDVALQATHDLLALDDLPVVLAVGSHEPRKNHVPVLHAAEHLWRAGIPFHLVFIGGSGWRSDRFHALVDRLREAGRPVQVLRNQPEDVLFAAYRLARFMVFPSLAEGFGLPLVEALLSGTPVITSNYGAMAEVAAAGGALTVDPRDTDAIEAAMRLLLTDEVAFARVRDEARALRWKTWDEYAAETWRYLVES
jgi:glycosyltransferase involved in cell wall biosynthesis